MFFKNLIVYRLPADWSVSAAELEEKFAARSLMPCGAFDMQSRGWVHSSAEARYVHTVNGQHLIALGVDQKLLPSSVVTQVAAERAKVIADEQGYPVGRRQMRELKGRVTEELRGRALTRKRVTFAWIDPANGWLVVDAAGESRADELIETLRDTLGSLQVTRLETERSPISSMTAWVAHGDAPLGFTIDDDLQLQSPERSTPLIRYKSCQLDAKEIHSQVQAGWQVTHLGLTWKDRIALVLNGKLQVKRVEFLELTREAPAGDEKSAAEQFDIDFAVVTGELAAMLVQLMQALGTEFRVVAGERQVRIAAQLYEMRDAAKTTLGANYSQQMAELGARIGIVQRMENCDVLTAAQKIAKSDAAFGFSTILVMAAAVEMIEPSVHSGPHGTPNHYEFAVASKPAEAAVS